MTIGLSANTANIALPFPIQIKGIKCASAGSAVLPLPANDGSYIINSGTGGLNIYSNASVQLYAIVPTSVNALATLISGFWLDTVNGVLWVVAGNATAGQGYLATVNYLTGVVTAIGAGFTGPTSVLLVSTALDMIDRAAIGTGDLVLWGPKGWSCSISSTTGLVTVAQSQLIVNGMYPNANYNTTLKDLTYHTADKTIFSGIANVAYTGSQYSNIVQLTLWRNGTSITVGFDGSGLAGLCSSTGIVVYAWGANVALNGMQMYTRVNFDAWLTQVANAAGLP